MRITYDIYLAHASENAEQATALCSAPRKQGLSVWFNEFVVGLSIREQMEEGIVESSFGVVLLSPEFFAKKWTIHELDGLLAIETPQDVRILPVWWGVTAEQVLERSPMLAMRSAAVYQGDVENLVRDLA